MPKITIDTDAPPNAIVNQMVAAMGHMEVPMALVVPGPEPSDGFQLRTSQAWDPSVTLTVETVTPDTW